MSSGKLGQYAEIIVAPQAAAGGAGEVDPNVPFTYSAGDTTVAEIVESGAKRYVHLVGQGSSTVDIDFDGDPTDGSTPVHLSGLVVCDDPSDNATTGEVTFGAFTDALPEEPPAPEAAKKA